MLHKLSVLPLSAEACSSALPSPVRSNFDGFADLDLRRRSDHRPRLSSRYVREAALRPGQVVGDEKERERHCGGDACELVLPADIYTQSGLGLGH